MDETETVSIEVFLPVEQEKTTVELETVDEAYEMIESESVFNNYQVTYRSPEYEDDEDSVEWIEFTWTLERKSNDQTKLENNKVLNMMCPQCGSIGSVAFGFGEFEHLNDFCSTCTEDVFLIRDQPTESGQSDVINYQIQLLDMGLLKN